MDHFGEVVRYLDALAFKKAETGGAWEWGRQPFVTISRQSGAGGHTVADAVLEELARRGDDPVCRDWLSFDDTLIRLLVKRCDSTLEDVVRSLAGAGKAIILGRGGVCLTRDLPAGVHVRLVAGRESRLKLLRRRLCLGEAEARRKLDELETSRAALIYERFGKDIDDPLLYDAVWNTDQVEPAKIAEWVADRVQEKARALSAQLSQRAASSA